MVFKETFENNDITFFMSRLAFQEGIGTYQLALFTTQSSLINGFKAPELFVYLGRNWLFSNRSISNISIMLSLGIARNWEFSYKYAPYGLSVILQVVSLWSAVIWDPKWSVSVSGTRKQTAVNRQNTQFPHNRLPHNRPTDKTGFGGVQIAEDGGTAGSTPKENPSFLFHDLA